MSCSRHPDDPVLYRCDGCGELLCERCVDSGKRLSICRLCGELALPADWRPRGEGTGVTEERERPAGKTRKARGESPRERAPVAPEPPSLGVLAINHVVIPAAIITMVASFLFYLLEVRSLFASGGGTLKWIGLCFVVATVLTARYGARGGDRDSAENYTVALALAMLLATLAAPWKSPGEGYGDFLVNLLIIAAVWRFATRLTEQMSLEDQIETREKDLEFPPGGYLSMVRRIRESGKKQRPQPRDPTRGVSRLALLALLLFAAGEPWLLSGPPETGLRALSAVILFLLSTGVVLAAATAATQLRRVTALGGEASATVLPGRVFLAAAFTLVVATVALGVPGVVFRGDGTLLYSPPSSTEAATEEGPPREGNGSSGTLPSKIEAGLESLERAGGKAGFEGREPSPSANAPPPPVAQGLLGAAQVLGRWLWIPVVILVALALAWAAWRFRAALARQLRQGLSLLRALLSAIPWPWTWKRRRSATGKAVGKLSLVDLETLAALPPRQAVVETYGQLLTLCEQLGQPRPPRATPLEHLRSLPLPLRPARQKVGELVEIYLRSAYDRGEVPLTDREEAVTALGEIHRTVT